MSLFGRLVGQKDDPLMERADTLVKISNASAIASFVPLLDKFPILREADTKHWDFILTIAAVFIAATRLRNLKLGDAREEKLMARIAERLNEWNPAHGIIGFEHCKSFFEKNFDLLTSLGHEPRFVASDAIGSWIAWDVLGRAPESVEERKLVRAVGVMITHEFYGWWNQNA